jgi:hypothetical protein
MDQILAVITSFFVSLASVIAPGATSPQATPPTLASATYQVLGATANAFEAVIFKVNVPAKFVSDVTFTGPANFEQGLSLGGSSLQSTGEAQFQKVTADNLMYGL